MRIAACTLWLATFLRPTVHAQMAKLVPHVPVEALTPLLLDAMGAMSAMASAADGDAAADAAAAAANAPLLVALLEAITAAGTPPPPLVDQAVAVARDAVREPTLAVPVLPFIDTAQAESLLPLLLSAAAPVAKAALVKLMHADPPPLPPARLLLTLHLLPTGNASGLSVKHLIEAIGVCLDVSASRNRRHLTGHV